MFYTHRCTCLGKGLTGMVTLRSCVRMHSKANVQEWRHMDTQGHSYVITGMNPGKDPAE